MPFVRVRSARAGDPLTEFDVPVALYDFEPDVYELLDEVPVADARAAVFPAPVGGIEPVSDSVKPGKSRK